MKSSQASSLDHTGQAPRRISVAPSQEPVFRISERSRQASRQMSRLSSSEVEALLDRLEDGRDRPILQENVIANSFEDYLGEE